MKIAIWGTSFYGVELALKLQQIGARVKIFGQGELGEDLKLKAHDEFWRGKTLNETHLSLAEYWSEYGEAKVRQAEPLYYEGSVLRIHKRFLSKNEEIPGHSRLHDLFRVVYEVKADTSHLEGEENAELREKMDEEVMESLKHPYESFEDFDFVMTAKPVWQQANPIGANESFALNERRVAEEHPSRIFYGSNNLASFLQQTQNQNHACIVGTGHIAARALLSLHEWLNRDPGHQLTLLTTESSPFQEFFRESGNEKLKKELRDFLIEQRSRFQTQCDDFEKRIHEWKALEFHERAKNPRPEEPSPQFDVYVGCNVTSVDKLVDREGVFLTLEGPDFRSHNLDQGIKVINAESVLAATGHKKSEFPPSTLRIDEPGFFTRQSTQSLFWLTDEDFESRLREIKRFFSPQEGDEQ